VPDVIAERSWETLKSLHARHDAVRRIDPWQFKRLKNERAKGYDGPGL
jgi:hypothetical protein